MLLAAITDASRNAFHQTIGRQQLHSPHNIAVTSNDELLVVHNTCKYTHWGVTWGRQYAVDPKN